MAEIDGFAIRLFEEAKRFLEKAASEDNEPFLHAALLLGFSSLEAHLNAISDELAVGSELSILDKSILMEKEYGLHKGVFELRAGLKIYRIEDRLKYLFVRYTKVGDPAAAKWWSGLAGAIDLRNKLVHPKEPAKVTVSTVEKALASILDCLNALYKGLYKRGYPGFNRKLQSQLDF